MKRSWILWLLLILLFTGCSSTRTLLKSETNEVPAKLAVLPVDNLTNDVAGSQILRQVIQSTLAENYKGYEVQSLEETDELLRNVGITDGGQLNVFHPLELNEILGVDGILYLKLSELELLTLPFYHVRRVDLTYSLYNMGKLLQEKPVVVVNRFVDIHGILKTLDDPGEGMNRALAGMAIGQGVRFVTAGIADHELKPEMYMAANDLLKSLPRGACEDEGYVNKVEGELTELRERVEDGDKIAPEKIEERERVEEEVTEGGIILF
ncbi:hypothetical protein PM10SUCC1_14240 [Propionigenium maris DSM 9537]|uniref:Uncharacterized protein n=1 Tax=Propionigenium maris DSM 9537 TaxID=1123000 RepID=A0A9W6LNG9_9FUSO|nr:GNA1162 family protein [Propionigenium maris]GLI55910.1 hypothetical protein PM10SUCC1_14240 [Propionigenium maris DSM 9537]